MSLKGSPQELAVQTGWLPDSPRVMFSPQAFLLFTALYPAALLDFASRST